MKAAGDGNMDKVIELRKSQNADNLRTQEHKVAHDKVSWIIFCLAREKYKLIELEEC